MSELVLPSKYSGSWVAMDNENNVLAVGKTCELLLNCLKDIHKKDITIAKVPPKNTVCVL